DVDIVHTPLSDALRADVGAIRRAITENTVLVAGSAPCYPFGVIDPIAEIAGLAAGRGVLCHVDACLGAYLLPFIERLGYAVPPWDFRVPGVTSISADLHKYGYSARGASVVLYRDRDVRRHQFFAVSDWPGALYGSPTLRGSRSRPAITVGSRLSTTPSFSHSCRIFGGPPSMSPRTEPCRRDERPPTGCSTRCPTAPPSAMSCSIPSTV